MVAARNSEHVTIIDNKTVGIYSRMSKHLGFVSFRKNAPSWEGRELVPGETGMQTDAMAAQREGAEKREGQNRLCPGTTQASFSRKNLGYHLRGETTSGLPLF